MGFSVNRIATQICHEETALAVQRLGWKQPKILNAGDPYQSLTGLIGNLSLNDISAFVMMVGEYELSLVMDLSHKVILLAPDSDMDRVARIVQQKGAGWSNLLVSNSPETSAAIEEKLSSLIKLGHLIKLTSLS